MALIGKTLLNPAVVAGVSSEASGIPEPATNITDEDSPPPPPKPEALVVGNNTAQAAQRFLSHAEQRLNELRAALQEHPLVDDTYRNYLLSEAHALDGKLKPIDLASFRADVGMAHERFLKADTDLALGTAREFLKANNFEQAENSFNRARAIAKDNKLPLKELEKQIWKVKEEIFFTKLEDISSALLQKPPSTTAAYQAMLTAKKIGLSVGMPEESIDEAIREGRKSAEEWCFINN